MTKTIYITDEKGRRIAAANNTPLHAFTKEELDATPLIVPAFLKKDYSK